MQEKNEEEMKEIEEEMKEIEKEIETIRAIFTKYSSQRWDSLRLTSSFREQEPNEEFHKFDPYSFDELKLKKSKLQDEKDKLLDEENLLLQGSLQGIKPFHFFTINDI